MLFYDDIFELDNSIDFLKIYDGKRAYYGGNQKWFRNSTLRKVGCSIVTAANITAYIAEKTHNSKIYNYKQKDKENFLNHMENIAEYIHPDAVKGVTSISYFNNQVVQFMKSRGVHLKANVVTIKDSFEKNKAFLKKGLNEDKPIAMLMLKNDVLNEFEWHWMTVTKLFDNRDKTYLDFSTWGERRIFTLESFYYYSSFGALSYFDV